MVGVTAGMHGRAHRVAVRHKVWPVNGGRFVLGDGGNALLRGMAGTGSVRAAADEVGWAYRHALAYLDGAARALGCRLVERARGGTITRLELAVGINGETSSRPERTVLVVPAGMALRNMGVADLAGLLLPHAAR
jgi:hypothetical protein